MFFIAALDYTLCTKSEISVYLQDEKSEKQKRIRARKYREFYNKEQILYIRFLYFL